MFVAASNRCTRRHGIRICEAIDQRSGFFNVDPDRTFPGTESDTGATTVCGQSDTHLQIIFSDKFIVHCVNLCLRRRNGHTAALEPGAGE